MSELTYSVAAEPTTVPVRTRESAPNPFTDLAGWLAENREAARVVTIPLSGDEDVDAKTIGKTRRLLSLAGAVHGVTLSVKVEHGGTKTKPVATLTVWARDRITRPRKADDASDAS